jgi:hypothetical protein
VLDEVAARFERDLAVAAFIKKRLLSGFRVVGLR